jgi:major facilitator superfamily transporter
MTEVPESSLGDGIVHDEEAGMSDEAWRLRFWSIFLGQALSLVGSAITQFVLLWWITDKTGSAAALATAGMAMLLPQAVLGPLGGVFADRHDRQIIMILTDLVSALCVLLLIMMFEYGNVELWQIYVLMATRSAMQAFQGPATMASVATLVPPDFVPRAAGFNQTVQGLSMVGAAPLGALLLSFVPVKYALGVDVLTAAIGISPLLFVTIPPVISTSSRHVRIWAQFRDGIQRIWSDRSLRGLYMLVTITTMFFMPLFTMIPLLVKSRYHGGPPQLALLESLTGVGMIIGGILVAVIAPKRKVPWVLGGMSLSCFLIAATAWLPPELFLVCGALWLIGASAFMLANASLMAVLQTVIAQDFQGRAISVLTTMNAVAAPVGLAIANPLGEFLGVSWLFFVFGLSGGFVMISGFLSGSVRRLDLHKGTT